MKHITEHRNNSEKTTSITPLTYVLRSMKNDMGRFRVSLAGITICITLLIVFFSLAAGMEKRVDENPDKYGGMGDVLEGWLAVLTWLIVILLAVIVASSLMVSAYRRKKEIATLFAVGISQKGIMVLVLIEGLVTIGFSYVLGVGIGLVLALINGLAFDSNGLFGFFLPTTINVGTMLITFVICIGITFIASILPVYILSRMDPVRELRYE